MLSEWSQSRGAIHAERRARGVCTYCGLQPRSTIREVCDGCFQRARLREKALRQRKLDDARKRQAAIDARRNRQCREVMIDGVTFIVTNSYDTESTR